MSTDALTELGACRLSMLDISDFLLRTAIQACLQPQICIKICLSPQLCRKPPIPALNFFRCGVEALLEFSCAMHGS